MTGQVTGQPVQASGEKRAPTARPVVDEGSTESDWSFFLAEWGHYVDATGIVGGSAICHLWQTCLDRLRRSLHNAGAQAFTNVEELLSQIKSLAVKRQNNLVNVMVLQGLTQERDKGVLSFLACPNGQADLCDLQVTCHKGGCGTSVSFKDLGDPGQGHSGEGPCCGSSTGGGG